MHRSNRLTDAVHAELLASVFATIAPTLVMSVLFAAVGGIVAARIDDRSVHILYVLGLVATVARLAVTFASHRRFRSALPPPTIARAVERLFAATYLAFALPFGLFSAEVLRSGVGQLDTLVAVLVVGYAAGVSTGVAMRPGIGVPAMLLAVLPSIAVSTLGGDLEHWALAGTLGGLLLGGVRSTLVRYRAVVADIERRHSFASMARTDPLTGLANRLGLEEHLDAISRSGAAVTIYYLDLDGFKPVNDRFGHPAGDTILRGVAGRLSGQLWAGDVLARVGGDEFVLVRNATTTEAGRQVDSLRLAASLAKPFWIGDAALTIGVSVGASLLPPRGNPRHAIAEADEALYRSKDARRKGGVRAA